MNIRLPASPDAPADACWRERLHGARVLLLAPHPDDESLATGGFIQHALRAGARLEIVLLTRGDNNPWPQRILERRLRIGILDRQRWARRRMDELGSALQRLGAADVPLHSLGWPDLGVTAHIQEHIAEALRQLGGIWQALCPDIVVMPSLHDTHPDHSACHVLARLVMAREGFRGTCLTYHVHGRHVDTATSVVFALDAGMRQIKHHAIEAHHSQVALARRRLLARAGADEMLHDASPSMTPTAAMPAVGTLPWSPPPGCRKWVRVTLAHPDGLRVWSWRAAPLQRAGTSLRIVMPSDVRRGPVFVKLKLRCTSPWIFDHWGWCDLTAAPAPHQASSFQQ